MRLQVTIDVLDAGDLADVVGTFAEALRLHRESLNRLNVYPVPDGDTGTNMTLTVDSAVAEIERIRTSDAARGARADMPATCKAISHGSLMGARGNSGVILCQILRGMSTTFAALADVGPAQLAKGLTEAAAAARAGVMRPVEGTILTVMSASAEGAAGSVEAGGDLVTAANAAREAAVEALARTPEMLPELAKAGVVDAGGAGLVLLFDAFLKVIDGRPLPEQLPIPASVAEVIADHAAGQIGGPGGVSGSDAGGLDESLEAGDAIEAAHEEAGVGDLRYEVMYFLEAPDPAIPAFKRIWAGIGDSIVVVGGEGLWNCHIHTDDIGGSIEAALDVGRPREIRVTDLLEQVEEEQWVRTAASSAPSLDTEPDEPAPVTSIVAVGTGAGIRRIFLSLGVRHVLAGGQSMNPSTEQILEIVEAVPSSEVIILPNNKNIYPVAKQVGALTEKHVRVVDTAGIQEGFAALLEYDPEAGADANAATMAAAAERVVAGEITRAVRVSDSPVGKVEAGDWIGLSRVGIESISQTAAGAACALLERLVGEEHEIVTLIEGSGATAADTRRITEWLRACRPAVTIERHHGGQPLYPYLISIE
jgi:hypothetical protein